MTKFTYLLLNLLTILFPLVLSFDKRVQFHKSWRYIWPGMAITGAFFLLWDVIFTYKGVWSFNKNYITGLTILNLPIEEVFFFLTVPFACIFIYDCVGYYIKFTLRTNVTKIIGAVLTCFCFAVLFFNYERLYTLVTFSLCALLLALFTFKYRYEWLKRFFIMYAISLVPFYIINGLLTSIPVVIYNNTQNMGIRVGTIPLEDHFYCMTLLLLNVCFYEHYKKKAINPR